MLTWLTSIIQLVLPVSSFQKTSAASIRSNDWQKLALLADNHHVHEVTIG